METALVIIAILVGLFGILFALWKLIEKDTK